MKARYLSVVAALLIASSQGCVLPESSYSVTGAVVIEKNPSSVNGGVELSASYSYPFAQASVERVVLTRGRQRRGVKLLEGQYRYSLLADLSELIVGPLFFLRGVAYLFRDLFTLDFKSETGVELIHLVTTLPVLLHSYSASDDPAPRSTGELRYQPWTEWDAESGEALSGRIVEVLDGAGRVLFEGETDELGELMIDVRESYLELFSGGAAPALVRERESRVTCPLALDPAALRAAAKVAGDVLPKP